MGIVPHCGDFQLAGLIPACHLDGQATLLLYISLDHLGGNAPGKLPVLAAFKQHRHHQAGIAPRCNPHEPGVVLHGVSMAQALCQGVLMVCALPVLSAKPIPSRWALLAVPIAVGTLAMASVMISQFLESRGTRVSWL